MSILADVAPYSREYQKYAGIVRHHSQYDSDLRAEYERIQEQVRQTKESTIQVAQKHFNAPVDTIEGTVKSASAQGIELAEYPGRTFHFSSVGSSMADLTASLLGASNSMTRAQAVREADTRISQRDAYLANVLAQGTHIQAVVPRGAAEAAEDIRAVILADGTNVNQVPFRCHIQNSRARAGEAPQPRSPGGLPSGTGLPAMCLSVHELQAPAQRTHRPSGEASGVLDNRDRVI
jgi:hypothetical protein